MYVSYVIMVVYQSKLQNGVSDVDDEEVIRAYSAVQDITVANHKLKR